MRATRKSSEYANTPDRRGGLCLSSFQGSVFRVQGRALLAVFAALVLLVGGCVSQATIDKDPLVVVEQLRQAGVKGRLLIMYGTGHIGGQAFNLSGSHGLLEITIDPNAPGLGLETGG